MGWTLSSAPDVQWGIQKLVSARCKYKHMITKSTDPASASNQHMFNCSFLFHINIISISFFLFWPLSAVSESVGFIGLQRLKPSPTPDGTFMSYKWRCGKKERKMKYIFGICNYVLESHFVWFVLEKCCYIS